jgi:hypothetical protein
VRTGSGVEFSEINIKEPLFERGFEVGAIFSPRQQSKIYKFLVEFALAAVREYFQFLRWDKTKIIFGRNTIENSYTPEIGQMRRP